MNFGAFLFRLGIFLTILWAVNSYGGMSSDKTATFLTGFIFIWLCYWVLMGFAK